jgi:mannosyltransferase OCH1-like enzyme
MSVTKKITLVAKMAKYRMDKLVYLLRETPLVSVDDRPAHVASDWTIPNTVYQTWAYNRLPKTLAASLADFRSLNPGLGFYLYDNQASDDFMHSFFHGTDILGLYNSVAFGPAKADLFRYCILYEFGGYYFDINKMCNVPLRSIHRHDHTALISFENNLVKPTPPKSSAAFIRCPERAFLQWGFGFAKGHRILELALELVVEHSYMFAHKIFPSPQDAIISFTGPGLFTKAVWAYFEERGDTESVCQLGIDFDGHGVFEVNGSWARNLQVPYYGNSRNLSILH